MKRDHRTEAWLNLRSRVAAAALSLFLLAPCAALAARVSFSLVRPDRSRARAGTVYLYREGSTRLERTVDPGEAVELAAGHWWWVAESPGYVSVDSGTYDLRDLRGTAATRFTIPLVPACTLTLAPDRRWKAVSKIAIISLHYGSLYPFDPNGKRKSVAVPEGGYAVYAVGPHGRNRLTSPQTCHAFEKKSLTYP